MIRRLAVLVLLLWGGRAIAQSPTLRVDAPGEGLGPDILARAIASPHSVVAPGPGQFVITRASSNPRTVIVLGRDAIVEGSVTGDVVVVGGDLYTHPGAAISGSAVAIGGGVYESMLATIGGPIHAFHAFTYDIAPIAGGFALTYRELEPPTATGSTLPGIFGFALPTYDRSNGLSIGFAPSYSATSLPLIVAPRVVYRSQLGAIDPSVAAQWSFDERTSATIAAGRETRTNDRWIRSDLVNSAVFLAGGLDARNYYRATFADLRMSRMVSSAAFTFVPYVGVSLERARSVRPGLDATGGPWTFLTRRDPERDRRLRPNPPVDGTTISSVRTGARWDWSNGDMTADSRLDLEGGRAGGNGFGQATFDGGIKFPTFGMQSLALEGHAVGTISGAPRQRWSYLGGSGTISTMELLAEGGDELAYVTAIYQIPIAAIQLPFIGNPVVGIREVIGGAGVGKLPNLHQAIGLRLSASRLYVEYLVDPATRKGRAGAGIAFGR